MYTEALPFALAQFLLPGAQSKERQYIQVMKVSAEVCPLCEGTGWKSVTLGSERRVTRCDCRVQARSQTLLAKARIPKRYEHCELSNFEFDGPHSHLAPAHLAASKFVEEYPLERTGLVLTGSIGVGKTHLAVGVIKELMRNKAMPCLFCDYRELLKTIQNSYDPSVQATEMGILRPIFDTEVLLIDELGATTTSEWIWDIVSFIINTRYNAARTIIVTTNFKNLPAASSLEPGEEIDRFKAKAAARQYTLGDRIGDRMRSRLHEMCRFIRMEGEDFRQKFRSASFG
jgi:DNA replication protein DnaC